MKRPLLIAAVCAGLPACTVQDAGMAPAPGTEPFAAHCDMPDNLARASSALPARASTRPEPQLGSVAPNTRVPSYVVTPSMRAMQKATAAQAGTAPEAPASCPPQGTRKG